MGSTMFPNDDRRYEEELTGYQAWKAIRVDHWGRSDERPTAYLVEGVICCFLVNARYKIYVDVGRRSFTRHGKQFVLIIGKKQETTKQSSGKELSIGDNVRCKMMRT